LGIALLYKMIVKGILKREEIIEQRI
jgi:hypothetical protein